MHQPDHREAQYFPTRSGVGAVDHAARAHMWASDDFTKVVAADHAEQSVLAARAWAFERSMPTRRPRTGDEVSAAATITARSIRSSGRGSVRAWRHAGSSTVLAGLAAPKSPRFGGISHATRLPGARAGRRRPLEGDRQPDVAWDDTPGGPRRPEVHRRRKPCERTRLDDDRSAGLRHHLLWLRGRQARRPPRRRRPWSSDAPCSQRGYDPTIHEPADMSASCRPVGIVVRHREPDRDTILGVTRPSAVPVSPRRWHGRCL